MSCLCDRSNQKLRRAEQHVQVVMMDGSGCLMVHSDGTRRSQVARLQTKSQFTVTTQHVVTVNCCNVLKLSHLLVVSAPITEPTLWYFGCPWNILPDETMQEFSVDILKKLCRWCHVAQKLPSCNTVRIHQALPSSKNTKKHLGWEPENLWPISQDTAGWTVSIIYTRCAEAFLHTAAINCHAI